MLQLADLLEARGDGVSTVAASKLRDAFWLLMDSVHSLDAMRESLVIHVAPSGLPAARSHLRAIDCWVDSIILRANEFPVVTDGGVN